VLGSLPLPFAGESLAEPERLALLPRVQGVLVDASTSGWMIDERRFEPLHRRLAELGWPLFLHPPLESRPPVYLASGFAHSVATVIATTLSAPRLILSGMLDRVPALDVVLPHLGGTIPYLRQWVADLNGRGEARHELGSLSAPAAVLRLLLLAPSSAALRDRDGRRKADHARLGLPVPRSVEGLCG